MTDFAGGVLRVVRGQPPDERRYIVVEPLLDLGQERDAMQAPVIDEARVYPGADWSPEERQRFWDAYLNNRTGTYGFRCQRYDAVIDQLRVMGMRDADSIADIGAGRMEFARRLRERGHVGMYVPIDGVIDGTDLNTWDPVDHTDWVVSIETIEHLHKPEHFLMKAKVMARYGVVVTTPNPDHVDVIALDPTHVSPVSIRDLGQWGFEYEERSMFTKDKDTIIGWYDRRSILRQRESRR
jgi:hypothetical protein